MFIKISISSKYESIKLCFQQAEARIEKGVCVGKLWVHNEMLQPRKRWLIQCSKCLKLGHLSMQSQIR